MCGSDDVGFLRSVKQSPCHRLPLFKFPCVSRSWIGSVGCWLSHDWIDAFQVTSCRHVGQAFIAALSKVFELSSQCTSFLVADTGATFRLP
jgi:hypothetical protein